MRWSPRITVLVGLLAGLALWVAFDEEGAQRNRVNGGEPQPGAAKPGAAKPEGGGAAAQLPEMPARATLQELRVDPFSPHSWQPTVKSVAAPPPAPSAPPLPYRFAGRLYQNGAMQVFFGKGDDVLTAKQGDTLDGQYRVESVSESEITLVYLPMGTRYKFQLDALLKDAEPVTAAARAANPPVVPAPSQSRQPAGRAPAAAPPVSLRREWKLSLPRGS